MLHSHKPLPVLGFHGTLLEKTETITLESFLPSESPIEWLGHGIYFWQDNPLRAFYWAARNLDPSEYKKVAIIQARLSLDNCLDLMDQYWQRYLRAAYNQHTVSQEDTKSQHPYVPLRKADDETLFSVNENWKPGWLGHGFNSLDCEVVNAAYKLSRENGTEFNSVRGVFFEGHPIYPTSHFFNRSHAQICVRKRALPTIADDVKVWRYEDIKADIEEIEQSNDFWKSKLSTDGQFQKSDDEVHFFEERMLAHIDSGQPDRAKMIAECQSRTLANDSTTQLGYELRRVAQRFLDDA